MRPFPIFIGYDSREVEAFHVLVHSLQRRASRPLAITPLVRSHLTGCYSRPRSSQESTEFSFTRFLVPFLCGWKGPALYLDCDMLCLADIARLEALYDPAQAVAVVQHDYVPQADKHKFFDQPNPAYPRKNWASVMLFNAARCRKLTPTYVSAASAADLHRLTWCPDDQIGALPKEWNWLVGEYPPNLNAHLLHYTLGGPWFPDREATEHAKEWLIERDIMLG